MLNKKEGRVLTFLAKAVRVGHPPRATTPRNHAVLAESTAIIPETTAASGASRPQRDRGIVRVLLGRGQRAAATRTSVRHPGMGRCLPVAR